MESYGKKRKTTEDGRELVEVDERGDRPKWTGTEVNIAAVADVVKNDRPIAS